MSIPCLCGCGGIPLTGRPMCRGHHRKLIRSRWYAEVRGDKGERILAHRLRAERALGRPLPVGVVVHHADGSKSPTAPLVICPDEKYHKLLHRRMKIVKAGGDPNRDRLCSRCGKAKPLSEFHLDRANREGRVQYCRPCRNKYVAELRLRRLCRP